MAPSLTRRQWLLLTGSGLLTACSSPKQRLAVQAGVLPQAWLKRLPPGWAVESFTPQGSRLGAPANAASIAVTDGWAAQVIPGKPNPWPQGPALEGLLPQALPLLPLGLPVGFGPWLLVLRNRADLLTASGERQGWSLLLDPSLRGKVILPASPRLVQQIAARIGSQSETMEHLRRQALGFNDRDALTLLLNGEAEAAVLPSRAVLPLLNRDGGLRALLPEQGAPLWWSMLVLPQRRAEPPPLDWLLAPRRSPLLDQLLRAGFTPPLQRSLLAAALARQPHAELLLPADELLARCSSLAPLRSAPEAPPGRAGQ